MSKILLISSMALTTGAGGYGGLERVAYEEALGLAEAGHSVTLIAAKGSKAPSGVALIECGLSWDKLTPQQQMDYARKDGVEREFQGQKWLARTMNGWRAQEEEAFHTFYEQSVVDYDVVLDMSWSKFSYTVKKDEIVGLCHSIQPYNSPPPREYPMLCGVSRGHSRFLNQRLQRPVRVIWNPVGVEEFTVTKDKQERVLSLNRIMATKGIHLFLDVIEKDKVKADVVGDDSTLVPDQGYVQFIKERCKQSAYASYHGLVPDATRNKFLADDKVLVCMKDAGFEEIFGLNLVEALASGTPVISLKTWGCDDVLTPETGVVCNNVDEVAVAVAKTMSGELKFDAEACRKRAEVFNRTMVTNGLVKMLESVRKGSRW